MVQLGYESMGWKKVIADRRTNLVQVVSGIRTVAPDSVELLDGACQRQPGGPVCRNERTSPDCSFIFLLFRASPSCTSFRSASQTDNEVAISTRLALALVTISSVASKVVCRE